MSKKKELKRINLKEIKDPSFLHDLSYKELDVLSKDIRENIIDSVSQNGGHLASNLGVVETTIALCRVFDFSKDKIIFDVGHQCYTYKILTGRSLERLRTKDGTSGFPKLEESKFDYFETGHSSTSISACEGMAFARDLKGEDYSVVAFIGDASIVNGLAFEALNNLGQTNHKVIIILNDNDMSITKPGGVLAKSFRSLSNSSLYRRSKHLYQRIMKTTRFGRWLLKVTSKIKNWFKRHLMAINICDTLDLAYFGPVDGHDIKDLENVFSKAKKIDKSVVVHVKTLKGKGYAPSENDDTGKWHGVGKFDKETGEIQRRENSCSWSTVYSQALEGEMEEHQNAYLLVPATGTGSDLNNLFKTYPNRCFDVGIAEEHAFTLAGGLAVSDMHPVISIYSTFLQRAYDELSHDLARMNLNATILIDRAGLVGNDGDTHQGIYDEQFLLGIPNVVVAMASNESEAKALLSESFNNHGVFCIRYPRESISTRIETKDDLSFGKWKQECTGEGTALVTLGPVVQTIKDFIIKNNKKVSLYNAIYQKPMDETASKELLTYQKVIIFNPYAVENGFVTSLCAKLLKENYRGQIIVKAIPDTFVKHASIEEQRKEFGISVDDICALL